MCPECNRYYIELRDKTLFKSEFNPALPEEKLFVSKENIRSVPNSAGVYFLYGEGGKLLYIGMSYHLRERLKQHLLGLSGFELGIIQSFSYRMVNMGWEELAGYETALIGNYNPPINVKGKILPVQ
jgi:excinuclease UvrABC nuclease subunit